MLPRYVCDWQPGRGRVTLKKSHGNAPRCDHAVHLDLTILRVTIGAAQTRCYHDQRYVPTEKLGQRVRLSTPRVFASPTADHQRISRTPVGQLGGFRWTVHVADLASEPHNRPTSEKGHAILYGGAMRNVAKILKVRTHRQGL